MLNDRCKSYAGVYMAKDSVFGYKLCVIKQNGESLSFMYDWKEDEERGFCFVNSAVTDRVGDMLVFTVRPLVKKGLKSGITALLKPGEEFITDGGDIARELHWYLVDTDTEIFEDTDFENPEMPVPGVLSEKLKSILECGKKILRQKSITELR